jgi:hypothetical protein
VGDSIECLHGLTVDAEHLSCPGCLVGRFSPRVAEFLGSDRTDGRRRDDRANTGRSCAGAQFKADAPSPASPIALLNRLSVLPTFDTAPSTPAAIERVPNVLAAAFSTVANVSRAVRPNDSNDRLRR